MKIPHWILKFRSVIGLVAICICAIIFSPRAIDGSIIFLNPVNLTDVLQQQAEIGIIALSMTLVIISGGIDLSVGSLLAFAASLSAMVLVKSQPQLTPAMQMTEGVAAAVGASALLGALNGGVIAQMGIQPFIMTLATMIGIRGLARWMTDNNNIDFGFGNDTPARFTAIFSNKPLVIELWLAIAVIFFILLEYTVFGRYVRAVGENEKAAGYTGLPIKRVKIAVYTLCGLATGIAGVIHAARTHQGNPNDGVAYELDAIAAVVIGGTSLSGGSGSILATVVGTLIMGILTNILRLREIDANRELMIKAVIIVVAVWMQSSRKNKS